MPSIPPVWLLSWRALPQIVFFLNKTERGGEEREKRKRRKGRERGEREKRRQQTASLNGPSAARAYELCSFAKRCTRAWIVFIFLARFSYVGGAFLLFLPARKCSKMHAKAALRQEDGRICAFWTRFGLPTMVSASGIDRQPPGPVAWKLHFRKLRGNFAVHEHSGIGIVPF